MEWIKTSERLPEWDKEVLGLRDDGFCDVIWWNGTAWQSRGFGESYVIAEDVYPRWMPLPELPEVEE